MILVSLGTAWALDCTGLNTSSCDAANAAAAQANLHYPGAFADDHPNHRRRARDIYDRFETVRSNSECQSPEVTLVGTVGGSWSLNSSTFDGSWAHLASSEAGTVSGTMDKVEKTFLGSYTGDTDGTVGDSLSHYNSTRQVIGNRDDGFFAGGWTRLQGRTGVHFEVYGDCSSAVPLSFDRWFDGSTADPALYVANAPFYAGMQVLGYVQHDEHGEITGPFEGNREYYIKNALIQTDYYCRLNWAMGAPATPTPPPAAPCNGCLFTLEVEYSPEPVFNGPCRAPLNWELPEPPAQQWIGAIDQVDYYSSMVYYKDGAWFQFDYQQEFSFFLPSNGQFYFDAFSYDNEDIFEGPW